MAAYKIIIAYDGTTYSGWLEQPNKKTVCGTLRKAFQKVFACDDITILGTSKTDAGVHALGQVARVGGLFSIDTQKLHYAWNNGLSSDILIRSVVPVGKIFHPHQGITTKIYRYYLCIGKPLPFVARYAWHVHACFDSKKLQEALQLFVGRHDFRSFCRVLDDSRNTIRTVDYAACRYYHRYRMWAIEVRGKRFLHYMVRRMVGAALKVASSSELVPSDISYALNMPDAQQHLGKAPAHGLCLHKVIYNGTETAS